MDWVVDCLVNHVEDMAKWDEICTEHGTPTAGRQANNGGGDGSSGRKEILLSWDSRTGISIGEPFETSVRPDATRNGHAGTGGGSSGSGRGQRQHPRQEQTGRQRERGQQDTMRDFANLFGALVDGVVKVGDGVVKVGGAVVSEIAEAHERHKSKRLERERAEALEAVRRGDAGNGDDTLLSHPIRPSTVTITEMSDTSDDDA